jgi:hypothetical protein
MLVQEDRSAYHCIRLVPLLVPVRGRTGERIGYTEAGCIEKRAGCTEAGCIEVSDHCFRCACRRDLHPHIYIISMSVYPLRITTSAVEAVVELRSIFEAGGLTRSAVT